MSARRQAFDRVVTGFAATIVWAAGLLAIAGVAILGAIVAAGASGDSAGELAVPVSIGLVVALAMGLLALPLSRGGRSAERNPRRPGDTER